MVIGSVFRSLAPEFFSDVAETPLLQQRMLKIKVVTAGGTAKKTGDVHIPFDRWRDRFALCPRSLGTPIASNRFAALMGEFHFQFSFLRPEAGGLSRPAPAWFSYFPAASSGQHWVLSSHFSIFTQHDVAGRQQPG